MGDQLRQDFTCAGYALATGKLRPPALIEVYPHPALLVLAQAERRLPYKFGKIAKYWPNQDRAKRRISLLAGWASIVALLEPEIAGVAAGLSIPDAGSTVRRMKAFEDRLDAVVCAWVGIRALEGRAEPLGNDESAIWVPIVNSASA